MMTLDKGERSLDPMGRTCKSQIGVQSSLRYDEVGGNGSGENWNTVLFELPICI